MTYTVAKDSFRVPRYKTVICEISAVNAQITDYHVLQQTILGRRSHLLSDSHGPVFSWLNDRTGCATCRLCDATGTSCWLTVRMTGRHLLLPHGTQCGTLKLSLITSSSTATGVRLLTTHGLANTHKELSEKYKLQELPQVSSEFDVSLSLTLNCENHNHQRSR